MTNKQCTKCKEIKSEENDFYHNKSKYQSWCIACMRKATLENWLNKKDEYRVRLKKWRKDNQDKYNEHQRGYRKEHPEVMRKYNEKDPRRKRARTAISNGIRNGRIVKPSSCELCGKNTKILEAHHWKGYDEKHWLDIQWLCKPCHTRVETENEMYKIVRSDKEIEEQLQKAESGAIEGSQYPGMSYEEGCLYFFQWLVGENDNLPFEDL